MYATQVCILSFDPGDFGLYLPWLHFGLYLPWLNEIKALSRTRDEPYTLSFPRN